MDPPSAFERERIRQERYRKFARQCAAMVCLIIAFALYLPFSGDPAWPVYFWMLLPLLILSSFRWRNMLRLSRPQSDEPKIAERP